MGIDEGNCGLLTKSLQIYDVKLLENKQNIEQLIVQLTLFIQLIVLYN